MECNSHYMATVSTVTLLWNGFTGAPGYSRVNFQEMADVATCNAAGAALRTFTNAVQAYMLSTWTVAVQPVVQHHDIATGDLIGETTMSVLPATVTGGQTPTTAYAGGSGAVINWVTGAFWQGRKVRGRTFLVPVMACYSNDGTVSTAFQNAVTAAGNALIADPTTSISVWAKKFDDETPPNQTSGALFSVSGCVVPDRAAQLRSRRS